jgi:hypothetical protein
MSTIKVSRKIIITKPVSDNKMLLDILKLKAQWDEEVSI